jgi:tetratricopeptide (TPR) repeat protein
MSCDWDWPGSERQFKRALELNPADATTRGFHAGYLKAMGRLEDSIAETRRGVEAEPLNLNASAILGRDLYFGGHNEQALDVLRKTIAMDVDFVDAHLHLGWVYEGKRMFGEAIAEFQRALDLSGGYPRFESALGHAYAVAGQTKLAEMSLARLQEQSKQRYVAPYDIAAVYAGLKETGATFKYLESAFEDRSFWMCWLRVDPRFEAIRNEPRLHDLLRRMHLTP